MAASFTTNPVALDELLKACEAGAIQLPDFQRSWVWDEERIKGLIASISQAFPVGALMTLDTGGDVNFAPRLIQGAPAGNAATAPRSLLLDGQQRMTSLYQTTRRRQVVETVNRRLHAVTSKALKRFGTDAFAVFAETLVDQDAFIGRTIEQVFGRVMAEMPSDPWAAYLAGRYTFLASAPQVGAS